MEPIISPWLVYLVSFLANVGCVASIIFIVSITVLVGCIFFPSLCYREKEARQMANKIMKKALIVAIISLVIAMVIPSKKDLLTMLALSYITPDNVQLIQGNIADFVKQIAQAVK